METSIEPTEVAPLRAGHPRFTEVVAAGSTAQSAWREVLSKPDLPAAIATVRGAFALGARVPERDITVIAIDRFAVHSLCYRVIDGQLHFAERADELVGMDAELDPQSIFDYLYFHCIPAPRTIFKDVYRLPPGHCAWLEKGELHVRPYWVPTFADRPQPQSFNSLREEFRRLLHQAVERELDSSTPACFLSGGTDSSTVAGLIGQVTGRAAHTYSIGFEAEGYDEMAFARIAARHFGTVHHEYYVTPDDLVRSIASVAKFYDQPFGNSSALPAYYCATTAKRNGVSRMLAGDGGDELFGGNSRYAKQRVFGWYDSIPMAVRRGVLEPAIKHGPLGSLPGLRKARSYLEQASVQMPERLQMYNLLVRLGTADVLTPEFLSQVEPSQPLELQQAVWRHAHASSELDRTLAFDWRFTLADSDLPKVRGTAAFAGVSVGFPLLDDDLVDFSTRLPGDYKLNGLKLRWFFKEALRGFLPDETIAKRKQGFGLPFGVWATRHAALNELAVESLRSLSRRGIVRPAFVSSLIDQRLSEHPGYYGEMVWILMMLEQWLQGRRVSVL